MASTRERGERPNKSAEKREMQRLQELAIQLVNLHAEARKSLDLPPEIEEAVLEHQRLKAREALRRHLQYLVRLMRESEDEGLSDRLQTRFNRQAEKSQQDAATFKRAEQWRNRLLEDGGLLKSLLAEYPQINPQDIQDTLDRAQREHQGLVARKGAGKQLFRLIFQAISDARG